MSSRSYSPPGCAPAKDPITSLAAVVSTYIRDHRKKAASEIEFFADQRTLANAIELAALAKEQNGKRHDHQHRIPGLILTKWNQRLQDQLANIKRCRNFEQLIDLCSTLRIRGIGKLAIYDTACRIGAFMHMMPDKVYLHAGTKIGATALGLGRGRDWILSSELPNEFQVLAAHEIEDCLCIYSNQILRVVNSAQEKKYRHE